MECITFLLFLTSLFILSQAQGVPKCREESMAAGGTLRLQPEKHLEEWVKVVWRVKIYGGNQQQILRAQKTKDNTFIQHSPGQFLDRAHLEESTSSLRISPVGTADSGIYRADFEAPSGAVTALCFHVSVWVSTAGRREVTRAVGRSVTFHLQNPIGDNAVWTFNSDIKVVVIFGDPPHVTFFDKSYEQRLAFPGNGSALTISHLTLSDTGTYTAKTLELKTSFTLHVFKELEVPEVTCVAQNCSPSGCLYTLSCTVPGSGSGFGNVSYSWSLGGSHWREGPTVLVESPPLEKLLPLSCTAQNPVSSHSVTVTALCAASTSPEAPWSYCWVKGLLCLLVLGSLVTAVAVTHVLIWRWGSPSHGAPGEDPPNRILQSSL